MVGRPARRPDRTTAVNSGRRRRRACAGNTSGGEGLATLAPATGEDRPARAGTHPQPEAVGLGPAAGSSRPLRGRGGSTARRAGVRTRSGRRGVLDRGGLLGWSVRLRTRSSYDTTWAVSPRRWAGARGVTGRRRGSRPPVHPEAG